MVYFISAFQDIQKLCSGLRNTDSNAKDDTFELVHIDIFYEKFAIFCYITYFVPILVGTENFKSNLSSH